MPGLVEETLLCQTGRGGRPARPAEESRRRRPPSDSSRQAAYLVALSNSASSAEPRAGEPKYLRACAPSSAAWWWFPRGGGLRQATRLRTLVPLMIALPSAAAKFPGPTSREGWAPPRPPQRRDSRDTQDWLAAAGQLLVAGCWCWTASAGRRAWRRASARPQGHRYFWTRHGDRVEMGLAGGLAGGAPSCDCGRIARCSRGPC